MLTLDNEQKQISVENTMSTQQQDTNGTNDANHNDSAVVSGNQSNNNITAITEIGNVLDNSILSTIRNKLSNQEYSFMKATLISLLTQSYNVNKQVDEQQLDINKQLMNTFQGIAGKLIEKFEVCGLYICVSVTTKIAHCTIHTNTFDMLY